MREKCTEERNSRQPPEVSTYDHSGVSPSLLDMAADAIAANAYGGQVLTENSEGIDGLIMSTGTGSSPRTRFGTSVAARSRPDTAKWTGPERERCRVTTVEPRDDRRPRFHQGKDRQLSERPRASL